MEIAKNIKELSDEEILEKVNKLLAEIRPIFEEVFGEDLPDLSRLLGLLHEDDEFPIAYPAREPRSTD